MRRLPYSCYLFLACLTLGFCYLFCLRYGMFGAKVDWISQHSVLPDYFRQGRFHENRTRRTFLRFPEEISGEEQVSGADPKFPEKVAVLLRECPAQNFRKEQALRSGPKFPESDRPPAGMAPVCGADSCRTAAGRLDVGTDALRGKPPADLFTAAARVRAILRFGVPAAIPGCNAPSRRRRGRLLPPA